MSPFTPEQAERHLDALRGAGWRMGVDRMQALCARLGNPERTFRSVHVVGTNGKSSVSELVDVALTAEGVRSGAYRSPHLHSWSERLRIAGAPIGAREFADAVGAVAAAAEEMAGEGGEDWRPSQFEQATAAAFLALARAGAEIAAIEAGLGGRLDATNVLGAEVVVLTSVGVEHSQWLGATVAEIAAEKLAVAGPESIVIDGRELSIADFRELNRELAIRAVTAILGRPASPAAVAAIRAHTLRARAQLVDGDPPLIADAAHNPAAAAALAAALPGLAAGRPVIGVIAVLDDKDLERIAEALAPQLDELVATGVGTLPGSARPGATEHAPALVAEAFGRAGMSSVTVEPAPGRAIAAARSRAQALGGVALITGSHYLLRHLWTQRSDHSYST